jgi:hypothetical protein
MRYSVPASQTEEGKQRERDYHSALGRFVDMFATVEIAISLTLWAYAKTRPNIAKVIFASTKIDQGSTLIKQLAEATDASETLRDDLEKVTQQLGIINGVRNAILHYGAKSIAEGNAIVSNALKAKREPTEFSISPKSLDDMTADLQKIATHLHYRHLGRAVPLGAFGQRALEGVLQSPWRYKHPSQPTVQTKAARSPQHHRRGLKPPHQR